MKKVIVVLIGVMVSLLFSWGVGQELKRYRDERQENIQSNESTVAECLSHTKEDQITNLHFEENFSMDFVTFEGSQETSDNPWNTTAGWIDTEEDGRCIFLTPNTAVFFEVTASEILVFDYEIHPWVKENSDGTGILLWVMDEEDTILYQEEILVSEKDSWKEFELDLRQYKGANKIKMFCNNGKYKDDNGDWVLVKLCETKGN